MAKSALIGEMRTRIRIFEQKKGIDEDGFPTEVWENVFSSQTAYVWCKWVNQHGSEVFELMKLELKDVATITMRYTPRLTPECRIFHENDPVPYEVISIDNINDARNMMEVKVRRMVTA